MLSYRHGFHAGSFADVFKHVVVTMLLQALRRKDKPFVYVDTHAGAGRYDLRSEMARKHAEHRDGIARLWGSPDAPPALTAYLETVAAINVGELRWYPGSPRIARHWLRDHDRIIVAECHRSEAPLLAREFHGDGQVTVVDEDGYHLIEASLPPRERRGLVLIDPSYELRDEPLRMLQALRGGHRRWATGVFAAWYPILPRVWIRPVHDGLAHGDIRRVLVTELCVYPDDNPLGINGSGMIIINPPWQFDDDLKTVLPWLWSKLSQGGQGRFRVDWLVPE
ncbi:MAG: 23S rRNA (adenine(2030)-N(6))-methyltransferase RlmJ [Chromatiales bacterium]